VVLAHGWGGRGVQMAPLALALAQQGFRCVFHDSAGHGESRREPISFVTIIGDFVALLEHLGETAAAWIGHSAGGQGMMAARARHGVSATSRYVCLSTPIAPYVPIDALRRETGASDSEIARAKAVFGAHFGQNWEAMERGVLYAPDPGRALLMVQDRADPLVRHEDADRIAAGWPGAVVFKTDGLGHNRVLRDAGVIHRIVAFVADAEIQTEAEAD
jgi:pimeloyl-ACP methyl ester carboxylesterase